MIQRFAVVAAVLFAVTACQDATSPRPIAAPPTAVSTAQGTAGNDYIVVFRSDESDPGGAAEALVQAHGGRLKHVYRTALKGFAVSNLPDAALEALQHNPRIALVERDGIMSIDATQDPTPSWGLDRIDAASGLDSKYTYPNTASNVTAYIIDTGINSTSTDFTGRLGAGTDKIDGDNDPSDCNGHGTHVAGTVGGTKYGVAKGVTIVAVRVLNCQGSGTTSGVIAGVDWVAANAHRPAVANMSLGGGYYGPLNTAVTNAIASGVTFAVAAGNSNASACNYSPSSTPNAITVGATTSSDAKASYSNYGTCVDINAPGSGITSDWIGGTTMVNTISGTSMASPHVAGAAALVLAANPTYTTTEVRDALVSGATNGAIGGLPAGTPNKLLYVGSIVSGPAPDPIEPAPSTLRASYTKSCNVFSCTLTSTSTGPIATTTWTFGDGSTATTTTVTLNDLSARTAYPFTLTVRDAGSGVASVQGSITCNPKKCQ